MKRIFYYSFPLLYLYFLVACTSDEFTLESPDNGLINADSTVIDTSFEILLLPLVPFHYANVELPSFMTENRLISGFAQMSIREKDNMPANNLITDAGATLGRVLFYDKQLSANGTMTCASCHVQEHGFSDPATFSIGFDGGITRRHSMTLINSRYYGRGKFFYNNGIQDHP